MREALSSFLLLAIPALCLCTSCEMLKKSHYDYSTLLKKGAGRWPLALTLFAVTLPFYYTFLLSFHSHTMKEIVATTVLEALEVLLQKNERYTLSLSIRNIILLHLGTPTYHRINWLSDRITRTAFMRSLIRISTGILFNVVLRSGSHMRHKNTKRPGRQRL